MRPASEQMDRVPATVASEARTVRLARLAGGGFVVVWSTGYLAGKVAVAHVGPFTALVWRFVLAALVFAVLAAVSRAAWPRPRELVHSAVVGLLSLALQFGGVYAGLRLGASAGIAALVIGAMPLATAVLARLAGERLGGLAWFGLALGFAGVLLVLADRMDPGAAPVTAWLSLGVGLIGIATGTLYQKRHASTPDLRVGLAVQHAAAAVALAPIALFIEGLRNDLSLAALGAIGWLVLVNSVGGFALLFALLRRGAATRVAALFYLVPPVTAAMGWLVFGETLTLVKLAGFGLAALGVYLGTRR